MPPSNRIFQTQSFPNSPTLGIIGCGNIGSKQAANFLAHGYTVYVHDINPDPIAELQSMGAHVADSCAELGTCADIIFTALPTPADVMTVVLDGEDNLSQGLQPSSIYIDITTNSPETVMQLYEAMQALGVEMLDAPFNDCSVGAQSQENMGLALLPSGSQETFKRVEPILQLMADQVFYCGEISSGTRCKLIHNAVNAIAVQAVSEGITLGLAQGIDLPVIWDTLRSGSFGQNPGDIHGLPHYWFSRRCDDLAQPPAFTVKLLHKDLRLALELARELNTPLPHLSLTIQDYQAAEQRGWSNHAATKVRCLQEERAGVTVKSIEATPAHLTPSKPQRFSIKIPRFSLSILLILILISNLIQFGLQWLFHQGYLF